MNKYKGLGKILFFGFILVFLFGFLDYFFIGENFKEICDYCVYIYFLGLCVRGFKVWIIEIVLDNL